MHGVGGVGHHVALLICQLRGGLVKWPEKLLASTAPLSIPPSGYTLAPASGISFWTATRLGWAPALALCSVFSLDVITPHHGIQGREIVHQVGDKKKLQSPSAFLPAGLLSMC